ncbi:Blp family class II bacteriocin [Streptococcus dysgalactiae]|uniref:Blp family class II bacteriocin n=1 Tax=Streptococcus dysgalactiae TaxID=1334 RepID=UPI0008071A2C|nr:Blp family class II bacteriocin [Streptococcus dysgalactiae]OBZ02177.1 hypothetical protein BBG02_02565 [Streptococcus dysgalactiae subsp. equisimilis]
MEIKKLETFHQMTIEKLAKVEGGKNNWQANVSGVIAAGSAGAAIGFPVCGVACGYIGAKTAITLWAAVLGGISLIVIFIYFILIVYLYLRYRYLVWKKIPEIKINSTEL